MKLRKLIALTMCLLSFFLISCNSQDGHYGNVKVTFMLEGGTYRNSEKPVSFYYNFKSGTENLIKDPVSFSKKEILRGGYHIDGWYKNKLEKEDGSVEYTEKWDFAKDKVTTDGITLYLKWLPNVTYTYDLFYKDEVTGKDVSLGSYNVQKDDKFDDYQGFAKRAGYTALGFFDKDGNPWDVNFKHPGGDTSLSIPVYVNFIKGRFEIVSTASGLVSAKSSNIYLACDIDMGGQKIAFTNFNKHIIGNGHKISNFSVYYDSKRGGLTNDPDGDITGNSTMCISLFGKLNGAVIENVTFENVKIELDITLSLVKKIVVSPFAISLKGATLKNVAFSGTYNIKKLPSKFEESNLKIVNDRAYYKDIDENSVVENVTVDFQKAV